MEDGFDREDLARTCRSQLMATGHTPCGMNPGGACLRHRDGGDERNLRRRDRRKSVTLSRANPKKVNEYSPYTASKILLTWQLDSYPLVQRFLPD